MRFVLLRALLTGLVLALGLAFTASAEEQITSYSQHIELLADGTVDVTEVIEVRAEGFKIRRGIFRDIPTFQVNEDNSRLRADLDVIQVLRNGRPEPYALESIGAGYKRIRIGDADVLLNHGSHRYTIRYTMTRQGRLFADHDELYWNATGNFWDFPILRSVTAIRLPAGAVISNLVGYTGVQGSTEQAVEIVRESDNTAIIRTTRALAAGEGVTVAAMFQKGILAEPPESERFARWLSDHRDLVLPLLAVIIVLGYYLIAWARVGRDPAKGTIIPLFHPPKGFSPALVHYIHRMGWENSGWTAFTASIFDLGVKGLLLIDNVKKTLKVTVTGKAPEQPLPPGEKLLFDYFNSKGTVVVNTTNGPKINETRGEFIKALETENRQVYFRNNVGYVVIGILVSIGMLASMLLFDVVQPVYLIVAAVAGIAVALLTGVLKSFWQGNLASKFVFIVWGAILVANIGGGFGDFFAGLSFDSALLAVASIVLINVVFGILMRAPTVQGRRIMDQIDGLKMYLETAEEKRLNFTGAPPMTVERFERLLPYAIALKVEKPWSEHFEAELSRHAVADVSEGVTYRPGWYQGSDWSTSRSGFSNSVAAVATRMSAAMIAAQPVPSSSSGLSGGGGGGRFSGRGRGRAGRGGW